MEFCGGSPNRSGGGAGYVQATGPDEYTCACAEGFASVNCEVRWMVSVGGMGVFEGFASVNCEVIEPLVWRRCCVG